MNNYKFTFLWFFLFLSLISQAYCTNPPKRKKTTEAAPLSHQHDPENDTPDPEVDAINIPVSLCSLAQWQSLNKEALISFF